jgi:hypothetical protein
MASIAAAYYAPKRLDRFVEAGPRLYIGCRTYPSAKAIGTIAAAAITMRRERIPRLVVKNVISGLSLDIGSQVFGAVVPRRPLGSAHPKTEVLACIGPMVPPR